MPILENAKIYIALRHSQVVQMSEWKSWVLRFSFEMVIMNFFFSIDIFLKTYCSNSTWFLVHDVGVFLTYFFF